jgi:hypothetical protein
MEDELSVLRSTAQNYRGLREGQLASPAPSAHCDAKDCACALRTGAETVSMIEGPACGFCSAEQCLCKDIGIRETNPTKEEPPTPGSPPQGTKRKRVKTPVEQNHPMEIDFTTSFTGSLSPTGRREIPSGGCGFCSESTPCVCLQNPLLPQQPDYILRETRAKPRSTDCTGEPGSPPSAPI